MAQPLRRDSNGFTPTQARIISVLADGQWHRQRELLEAIDEMAEPNLLKQHIFNLRRVIEGRHEVIITTTSPPPESTTLYRWGTLLAPMING